MIVRVTSPARLYFFVPVWPTGRSIVPSSFVASVVRAVLLSLLLWPPPFALSRSRKHTVPYSLSRAPSEITSKRPTLGRNPVVKECSNVSARPTVSLRKQRRENLPLCCRNGIPRQRGLAWRASCRGCSTRPREIPWKWRNSGRGEQR